ncbi:LmbE-like protein [Beggiatoa sp. SS]|nr:LmbE-like protein [Beggiatoa sp. SS]
MESLFIPYTATTLLPTGHVLVLAPHPDDEVFGCGGAIMQHLAQENSVSVIIATDGSAATTHPDQESLLNYIKTRQQESYHAAQILGYGNPDFLGITDRTLECSEALIQQLFDYIQDKQITQVYAPSVMEIHPDHYTLALIAVEAVRRCGESVSLAMYEIGAPLHPNVLLDITRFFKRKQEAMACFVSQLAIQEYDRHIEGLNSYRCYTLPKMVRAVEGFYVVDGATLQKPDKLFGRSRQSDMSGGQPKI